MATDGRSASRAAADARRMTREGDRDLTRVIVAGATCAISACALTTLYWRAVCSSSSNSSSRSVGGDASGRDDADEPRSHDATSARKKRRAKKKAAAAAGGSDGGVDSRASDADSDAGTTSSSRDAAAPREPTRAVVDQLVSFHFGGEDDVLGPFADAADAPRAALRFHARLADLCARHAKSAKLGKLGAPVAGLALDVGCAVGGASFELSRRFRRVVGADDSKACVAAASLMKHRGRLRYAARAEGDIAEKLEAIVPAHVDRERVDFRVVADVSALPPSFRGCGGQAGRAWTHGLHDAVLVANALCRMSDPLAFLSQCARLVKPCGVLVLASPYDWSEARTPRAKWLGGRAGTETGTRADGGGGVRSFDALRDVLTSEDGGFDLVCASDVPFLVREHARKYAWGVSHATVWRRRE